MHKHKVPGHTAPTLSLHTPMRPISHHMTWCKDEENTNIHVGEKTTVMLTMEYSDKSYHLTRQEQSCWQMKYSNKSYHSSLASKLKYLFYKRRQKKHSIATAFSNSSVESMESSELNKEIPVSGHRSVFPHPSLLICPTYHNALQYDT